MSASELPSLPVAAPQGERPAQAASESRLRLLGLTPDRERLLMSSSDGSEFTVAIDSRLRAALSGDPSRPPQSAPPRKSAHTPEKPMETTLRPRDIQARIRAGATPESVAEAAGSSVEKVMTYAAPVLAEREHVAQRALRASLRRHSGEQHTLGRTLGEAVNVRLRGMNVDPDSVLWDAWRREDGRWTLTAAFQAGGYDGLAELCFDQRGNFVTIDNDQARWLIGDAVAAPTDPADDVAPDGPRLSAVPAPTELGADAIDLVSEPESVQAPDSPAAQDTPVRPDLEATMDQPLIDESLLDLPPLGPPAEAPQAPRTPEAEAEEQEEVPEPAPTPARKKRMSVPSWDEILFGGSDQPS